MESIIPHKRLWNNKAVGFAYDQLLLIIMQ